MVGFQVFLKETKGSEYRREHEKECIKMSGRVPSISKRNQDSEYWREHEKERIKTSARGRV